MGNSFTYLGKSLRQWRFHVFNDLSYSNRHIICVNHICFHPLFKGGVFPGKIYIRSDCSIKNRIGKWKPGLIQREELFINNGQEIFFIKLLRCTQISIFETHCFKTGILEKFNMLHDACFRPIWKLPVKFMSTHVNPECGFQFKCSFNEIVNKNIKLNRMFSTAIHCKNTPK